MEVLGQRDRGMHAFDFGREFIREWQACPCSEVGGSLGPSRLVWPREMLSMCSNFPGPEERSCRGGLRRSFDEGSASSHSRRFLTGTVGWHSPVEQDVWGIARRVLIRYQDHKVVGPS